MIALVVLLSGCASAPPRATKNGKVLDIWSGISTKDFIRVRGIGAVQPEIVGQVARRGASRNAALVSARYQLLALVRGVKLEGGVTISQLMEQDSLIREIANEIVAGGEEVLTEWLPDDGCVVTLELKRSKVERLIQEKSLHEKDLEQRVDYAARRIKYLESSTIFYMIGQNINDRQSKILWRRERANRIFGLDFWPFTWLAGGGDYDCMLPLRPCYWVKTRSKYTDFPDEGTKQTWKWMDEQRDEQARMRCQAASEKDQQLLGCERYRDQQQASQWRVR